MTEPIKLYTINDIKEYHYTPVYFTTDKEKAERLVKEFNEYHHRKHWKYYDDMEVEPSMSIEECKCQKYEIIEKVLEGPTDHLYKEYPNSDSDD